MDHVGEDGGGEAGVLEGGGPGEHGVVEAGGPHEDIVLDEGVDLGGGKGAAGEGGEFAPEGGAVEAAEVVVVAVAPVVLLEGGGVEAGEAEQSAVGRGIGGAEDVAVVEDDSAHEYRVQAVGHRAQASPGAGWRLQVTGSGQPGAWSWVPGSWVLGVLLGVGERA